MTILELRFPAGRFHATPWGRHVNEGAVEWPPSPWRLLRSLIATWFLKARHDVKDDVLRGLIDTLASHAPQFHLPNATNGHTRHYMPIVEGKNEKTTKIFDTFIQLPPTEGVLVAWDIELPPEQLSALRILSDRLGYFGRAESLVLAQVRADLDGRKINALPLAEGDAPAQNAELVRLLAPITPTSYQAWSTTFTAQYATPEAIDSGLSTKKVYAKKAASKKTVVPIVPKDIFAALHADTGDLQSAGWNLPPGAAWMNYTRSASAFAPAPRKGKPNRKAAPTAARYAVVSKVTPSITDAVSVANRVHEGLCKWSDQGTGRASVFTGKDTNGQPLPGHLHAHVFCEANGPRDAITHITVTAAMGFDEQACLALRRLNRVWGRDEHDLRLVLIGLGNADTFPDCSVFGSSKIWRSLTPFIPTRHAKTFRDGRPKIDTESGWQIGSPAHDLLRLLSLDSRTSGAKIKQEKVITLPGEGKRTLRSLQYLTHRRDGGGSRGNGEGGAFTLEFPNLVSGPLAFGYGSHFGLGLFVPVD